MDTKVSKLLLLAVALGGLFVSTTFAQTRATVSVTPSTTTLGGTVFFHAAVGNLALTNEDVTVTLSVMEPGIGGTEPLPLQAGAFAFGLLPNETRLADLSFDIPASGGIGTYRLAMVVTNSAGKTLAIRTTKFTVLPRI